MAERERDAELWARRVVSLAHLGRADALAVVLPLADGRPVAYATHNLGSAHAWLPDALRFLIGAAMAQRAPQRRDSARLALADGRVAQSLVVVPIDWNGNAIGALVAARVSSVFAAPDLAALAGVADLAGLELAVSSLLQRMGSGDRRSDDRLRQAEEDRRHAIALYEVSRLMFERASTQGAREAAAVVAEALGYEVVGIWRAEPDGMLALTESHGYGATPPRVWPDELLERVLREGTTERAVQGTNGGTPWMGPATEAIASPIGTSALLVVGRIGKRFTPAEVALAPTLGESLSFVRPAPELAAPPQLQLPDMFDEPTRTRRPRTRHQRARIAALAVLTVALASAAAGFQLGEPTLYGVAAALGIVALLLLLL